MFKCIVVQSASSERLSSAVAVRHLNKYEIMVSRQMVNVLFFFVPDTHLLEIRDDGKGQYGYGSKDVFHYVQLAELTPVPTTLETKRTLTKKHNVTLLRFRQVSFFPLSDVTFVKQHNFFLKIYIW